MKKIVFCFIVVVATNAFAQGGTTGTLTWNFNPDTGTLTIGGEGEMPDYDDYFYLIPWYSYRSSITTVVIENGVINIGGKAFEMCIALTSVTISNSVTSIGFASFSSCNALTSITIPNSVTDIGYGSFAGCRSLTSIAIPNSVTSIGWYAFSLCKSLLSITIPGSVTSIGYSAFENCLALTSVDIQNGVTNIGDCSFSGCTALASVTIPNSVTSIGDGAFDFCSNLLSITIPNSVTNIGIYAFSKCSGLTSITNLNPEPIAIPPSVFYYVNVSACMLKVPVNAVSDYKNADVWKEFNIMGGDYLVRVCTNNNEYGYATGDELCEANAIVTVTATAYSGYKFVSWTKDGIEVSMNNPYSFTVIEDVELVANFDIDETGIETIGIPSVKIFPNPTSGELKIENGELKIKNVEVFDLLGRKQKAESGISTLLNAQERNVMDISCLPAGMYFVRIATGENIIIKKIIKY